jgi:hypothetical protein
MSRRRDATPVGASKDAIVKYAMVKDCESELMQSECPRFNDFGLSLAVFEREVQALTMARELAKFEENDPLRKLSGQGDCADWCAGRASKLLKVVEAPWTQVCKWNDCRKCPPCSNCESCQASIPSGYTCEYDKNYFGQTKWAELADCGTGEWNYCNGTYNASLQNCADACDARIDCTTFTFVAPAHSGPECWLKSDYTINYISYNRRHLTIEELSSGFTHDRRGTTACTKQVSVTIHRPFDVMQNVATSIRSLFYGILHLFTGRGHTTAQ